MKFFLYKITNKVNNKCYIGITNDLWERWTAHARGYTKGSPLIKAAINKYGLENLIFECIETAESEDEIKKLEVINIGKHKSQSPGGYNITAGGDDTPYSKGESNGRAKVTEKDVINIRKRYAAGESQVSLSKEFNVSRANIGSIVRGETWADVGGAITLGRRGRGKRQ